MIFIRRPTTEPPKLAKQRRAGLKRAFAALNAHGADSKELVATLRDYDGGKAVLFARTESVCVHVDRGQHAKARAEWRALGRDLVRSDSVLAGPTWNALHYLVDPPRRATANLPIPPRP